MSKSTIIQEAHLRVVIHNKGNYQLVFYAELVNFDLYAGVPVIGNKLRSSWHESGQVHTHTPAGRLQGLPRILPKEFKGKSELYQGGTIGNDWTYQLKPDSKKRRTLIIEKSSVERGLSCTLWAVESGKEDLVSKILEEYDGPSGLEIVSYITIDWTQPQLVGVVRTLKLAAWESSMRSML